MRTALLVAALLCGCATAPAFDPEQTDLGGDPVILPTTTWGGYFLAQGELDGCGPFTFMLDTGADCMLVSPSVASQLAAQVRRSTSSVRGAIGDVTTAEQVLRIDSLWLGASRFRGFSALVMDVGQLSEALGTHIDGVLGLPLFADCLLTLDYPSRQVWLSHGELPAVDGREILALDPESLGAVTARLGGDRIAVKIDSGFSREIGLPSAVNVDFLSGPTPGSDIVTITGTHRQQEGRLADDLQLGHHVFLNPHAAINGGDPKLGSRLLRHFSITFDQHNDRVRFARQ